MNTPGRNGARETKIRGKISLERRLNSWMLKYTRLLFLIEDDRDGGWIVCVRPAWPDPLCAAHIVVDHSLARTSGGHCLSLVIGVQATRRTQTSEVDSERFGPGRYGLRGGDAVQGDGDLRVDRDRRRRGKKHGD